MQHNKMQLLVYGLLHALLQFIHGEAPLHCVIRVGFWREEIVLMAVGGLVAFVSLD
jgi:hypothetical protein